MWWWLVNWTNFGHLYTPCNHQTNTPCLHPCVLYRRPMLWNENMLSDILFFNFLEACSSIVDWVIMVIKKRKTRRVFGRLSGELDFFLENIEVSYYLSFFSPPFFLLLPHSFLRHFPYILYLLKYDSNCHGVTFINHCRQHLDLNFHWTYYFHYGNKLVV